MTRDRAFRIAEKAAAYGPFVDGHIACQSCGEVMVPVGHAAAFHALRGHLLNCH